MPSTHLLRNELVKPARIKVIPVESIRLQQRDEVLYRRPKVPTDRQLLQREDHVPPSDLPRLSPAETVTKLRVGELVETTRRRHAEVTPHVVAATKVELCHCSTAWSKTL